MPGLAGNRKPVQRGCGRLESFLFSLGRRCCRSSMRRSVGSAWKICSSWILVIAVAGGISGCAQGLLAEFSRPVHCMAPEVFVRSARAGYPFLKIGILPTVAPSYARSAAGVVTSIYYDELLRSRGFRSVIRIPHRAAGVGQALWWGRDSGCDLVMTSKIRSLWYGSGALPTRLEIQVRIYDVRTGDVLWSLRQKASSEPGPVLDIGWNTFAGQPARLYPVLARRLAVQLARMLSPAAKSAG